MKRSFLYLGGIALITFTAFLGYYNEYKFANYKNSSNTDNAFYIDKQEYQKEVGEWREDKINKQHPLSNLFKDNIFILEFEDQDNITVIRVLRESESDSSTVTIQKWQTKTHFKKPISLYNYQRQVSYWRSMTSVGLGRVFELSKSEFLNYINSASNVNGQYGQVWDFNQRHKSFSETAMRDLRDLLIVSFLIFIVSYFARILAVQLGLVRKNFELVVYSLLPWILLMLFEVIFRQDPIDISIIDIINPIIGSAAILVFLLTKDRIIKSEIFGERESLEFFYILVISIISTFIGIAIHNEFFNRSYDYIGTGVVRAGFIIAIPNFLNNFRIHYFKLRKDGKSLIQAKVKEQQSTSELSALQSRVNPHFLYNSLNSIAALAETDPSKTKDMALALSNFYKYSTNREDEIWTTCGDEVDMIKNYLEIEKIRFGNKLKVDIQCGENVANYRIPKFLIQPLVENAIKYGYDTNSDTIHVIVEILKEGNYKNLTIKVLDAGPDFPDNMDMGHGIRSVQKKLMLTYPDQHYFSFTNQRKSYFEQQMKGVLIIIDKPKINA